MGLSIEVLTGDLLEMEERNSRREKEVTG